MGISCELSHLTRISKAIRIMSSSISYPQLFTPSPTSPLTPNLHIRMQAYSEISHSHATLLIHQLTQHLPPLLLPLPLPSNTPQPHPLPLPPSPHLPNFPPPLPLHQPHHPPIPPPPLLKTKPTHRLLPYQRPHRLQQFRKRGLEIRAVGCEEDVGGSGDGGREGCGAPGEEGGED